jgi:hypothetical protein
MNILDKVKALFAETENTMAADTVFVKTKDGLIFNVKASELAVDAEIVMIDEAGVEQPIEDGDYVLEDDSTISIKAGLVSVITPEVETPAEDTAEAGVEEEVMAAVIEAGDYTLENGDVITIDDKGMVTNLVKAEVEIEEVPVAEVMEAVNPRIAELEAELELRNKEIVDAKEAFEKLKSEPATTALDVKKFEKTETIKTSKKDSMLSKVQNILNK